MVSTTPTIGIPRRAASATAISSFLVSTTNTSEGGPGISLIPANTNCSRSRSRVSRETSFLDSFSKVPSVAMRSRSCRRLMLVRMVLKLVSIPPSQRSVT